jgi:hypothetical protein
MRAGVTACRRSNEGSADARLSDEHERAPHLEPLQAIDFLDLGLGDRTPLREVEVLERRLLRADDLPPKNWTTLDLKVRPN